MERPEEKSLTVVKPQISLAEAKKQLPALLQIADLQLATRDQLGTAVDVMALINQGPILGQIDQIKKKIADSSREYQALLTPDERVGRNHPLTALGMTPSFVIIVPIIKVLTVVCSGILEIPLLDFVITIIYCFGWLCTATTLFLVTIARQNFTRLPGILDTLLADPLTKWGSTLDADWRILTKIDLLRLRCLSVAGKITNAHYQLAEAGGIDPKALESNSQSLEMTAPTEVTRDIELGFNKFREGDFVSAYEILSRAERALNKAKIGLGIDKPDAAKALAPAQAVVNADSGLNY